ncbi:MAG: hypothetical protein HKO92_01575 [Flavobacteriaceae bacterium]|nr:hypothetical protein [Flavobacteriaceae bacterium]
MKTLKTIIRLLAAVILIAFQQALIIGIGFLVYVENSNTIGILIWLLCLPMLYLNYKTYKYVMKYGFINFMTINADTSDIDVPKGKRWYDDKV